MSKLNLLIGSNGAGKTKYIYDLFKSESRLPDGSIDFNKKFYLIVPEQDTASKQKDMMDYMLEFGHGILNIDVISFDRLVYMVSEELGININDKYIVMDDAKTLLVRLAIINLKKKNVKFKYFDKNINNIGFAEKLTSCFSEFYSYGVDDIVLDKLIEKVDDELIKSELTELKIIQNEFLRLLKQKQFLIKEDKLNMLRDNIINSKLFDNAVVAFDGFTGFIPVQKQIFKIILKLCDSSYVTVTYRQNEYNNLSNENLLDIFNLSKIFLKDLREVASELACPVFTDLLQDMSCKKYKDKPDLKFIEENIFRYDNKKSDLTDLNFQICSMKNINLEVDYTISKIFELVKFKKYKYSDIKIVVPSVDDYRDVLYRKFYENDIPLYIDYKQHIYNSPIIEAVRSIIEILCTNFSTDSVLRYLNCGLFDKEYTDKYYLLDNCIRKYGLDNYVKFKSFDSKMQNIIDKKNNLNEEFTEDGEKKNNNKYYSEVDKQIEYIRIVYNEFFKNLFVLYEDFQKNKFKMTIKSFIYKIIKFVNDDGLENKYEYFLNSIKNKIGESSIDYNSMSTDVQMLKRIFDLLTIISQDDTEYDIITINEFRRLFDLSVDNIEHSIIPYKLDQVVVGDLMRSRYDNPKILFFLGMNDSKVPSVSSDNNIINDDIRDLFDNRLEIKLSQTTTETSLNSRFYVYLALTNPTDYIYISYVTKNVNGEVDYKSSVIKDIQNMFHRVDWDIAEMNIDEDDIHIFNINKAKHYLAINYKNIEYLKNKLDKKEAIDKSLIDKFKYLVKIKKLIENRENDYDEFETLVSNNSRLYNDREKLNKKLVTDLIGEDFVGSPTSIENYASCPYKYFAEKTLGLKAREIYKIENYDIGNIIHYYFKWFFDEVSKNNLDITELDDITLNEYVENGIKIVYPYVDKLDYEEKKDKFLIERLKDIISVSIGVIINQQKKGAKASLILTEYPNMNIDLKSDGSKYKLVGKIDKVEFFKLDNDEDNIYVKVVDYKSSIKNIDPKVVKSGALIQFLIYLDFCINHIDEIEEIKNIVNNKKVNVIAIGSFYSPIIDNIVYVDNIADSLNSEIVKNKMTGVMNKNEHIYSFVDKNLDFAVKKSKSDVVDISKDQMFDNEEIKNVIKIVEDIARAKLEEIKNGMIEVKPNKYLPKKPCEYCIYKDLCKNDSAYYLQDDEEVNNNEA